MQPKNVIKETLAPIPNPQPRQNSGSEPSTTIKVWRLENEHQQGVYTAAFSTAVAHSIGDPPTPRQETTLKGISEYEYCCFSSPAQMRRWFPKKKDDCQFTLNGVEVSVYEIEAEHVRHGEFQALFPIHLAKKVDRQPLENF